MNCLRSGCMCNYDKGREEGKLDGGPAPRADIVCCMFSDSCNNFVIVNAFVDV